MEDGLPHLLDVQDGGAPQGAPVGGLAAPLGEEGGAVQGDLPGARCPRLAGEDLGREGAAVAVLVVEFLGHRGVAPFSILHERGDSRGAGVAFGRWSC